MRKLPRVIYTDGACSGNPGAGGWAAIIVHGEQETILVDGEKLTTNNRMELMAAISALRSLVDQPFLETVIYTDSQYVKNGITIWVENWKKNGWKTAKKELVKNVELWRELDELNKRVRPIWQWVKGHDGDEYNERCDKLAVEACNKYKEVN